MQQEIDFYDRFLKDALELFPENLRSHIEEINDFRMSLITESDRAIALMAAAFLEDFLARLISGRMIANKSITTQMFEHNGPLGTFSAKIDTAYAFGLISKPVHKDLHLTRKIRNDFAHTAKPLEFTEHSIRSRCSELTCGGIPPKKDHPKNRFNRTMMTIAQDIATSLMNNESIEEKKHTISHGKSKESLQALVDIMKKAGLDPSIIEEAVDLTDNHNN